MTSISCSPQDLGEAGNGFGNLYRIYPNKAAVKLSAPAMVGTQHFSHWRVLDHDGENIPANTGITVKISSHTTAYCHYEPTDESVETVSVNTLDTPRLAKIAVKDARKNTDLLGKINHYIQTQTAQPGTGKTTMATTGIGSRQSAARRVGKSRGGKTLKADMSCLIRIAPTNKSPVVAATDDRHQATILSSEGKWQKVQLGNVIGYRKAPDST